MPTGSRQKVSGFRSEAEKAWTWTSSAGSASQLTRLSVVTGSITVTGIEPSPSVTKNVPRLTVAHWPMKSGLPAVEHLFADLGHRVGLLPLDDHVIDRQAVAPDRERGAARLIDDEADLGRPGVPAGP